MYKVLVTIISLLILSACSVTPDSYKSNNPTFSFSDYFDGKLCAWGTLKDRSGQMTRKFIANIDAYKRGPLTVLDEQFIFSDGEKQTRVWKFTENGEQLTGTAGDVVGQAKGQVYGDSLHLTYTLDIPRDDGSIEVNMDDWLHLIDRNTLMGTTQMSKWGFDLGRIDIVIQKKNQSYDCFTTTTLALKVDMLDIHLGGEINAAI
jgi:hypothetical protein